MKTYTVEIDCGETTCASSPGNFCAKLGAKNFGTKPVCMLFNNQPLYDLYGWLQRCDDCMKSVE